MLDETEETKTDKDPDEVLKICALDEVKVGRDEDPEIAEELRVLLLSTPDKADSRCDDDLDNDEELRKDAEPLEADEDKECELVDEEAESVLDNVTHGVVGDGWGNVGADSMKDL